MAERIWGKVLTARDKLVFAASGYGARAWRGASEGSDKVGYV